MCGSLEAKRGQEGLQAGVGVQKRIRAALDTKMHYICTVRADQKSVLSSKAR